MATTNRPPSSFLSRLARAGTALALGLALLAPVPAGASAANVTRGRSTTTAAAGYGWPVAPFFRQHPVRGFFGDPRIGLTPKGMAHSFHFGIDVSCPNGTPVYATVDGRVVRESFRPETVSVVADDGHTVLQYWHIEPAVRAGQRVTAYRTVVGHVLAPWEHVHLAEVRDGRYVNPLRAGALRPFADWTRPTLRELRVERDGRTMAAGHAPGTFDLVVEAYDATPLPVPGRWAGKPLTPALLRWRLVGSDEHALTAWKTAVDVRATIPSNDLYDNVFARWTRQNKAARGGRYRFYLAHDLDASRLARGRYLVEVEASDIRGNAVRSSFALVLGPAV